MISVDVKSKQGKATKSVLPPLTNQNSRNELVMHPVENEEKNDLTYRCKLHLF